MISKKLVTSLIISAFLVMGTLPVAVEAASIITALSSVTISPGAGKRWYPSGTNGFNLTNGANQELILSFTQSGNKISYGLWERASNQNHFWQSNIIVSGSGLAKNKTLNTGSGIYQPVLYNKNATVSLSTNKSYFTHQ